MHNALWGRVDRLYTVLHVQHQYDTSQSYICVYVYTGIYVRVCAITTVTYLPAFPILPVFK